MTTASAPTSRRWGAVVRFPEEAGGDHVEVAVAVEVARQGTVGAVERPEDVGHERAGPAVFQP